MNIKALAIASTLALGSIFGSVSPAEAAAARCWVGARGDTASAQVCEHFLPADGEHIVYLNGTRYVFELYTNGRATINVNGNSIPGEWTYHEDGGIQVDNLTNGYWLIFERN